VGINTTDPNSRKESHQMSEMCAVHFDIQLKSLLQIVENVLQHFGHHSCNDIDDSFLQFVKIRPNTVSIDLVLAVSPQERVWYSQIGRTTRPFRIAADNLAFECLLNVGNFIKFPMPDVLCVLDATG
jgi:hypothetical protein